MRNLLLFILILIAIWWVRRALANLRGGAGTRGAGDASTKRTGDGVEPMLACRHCGVHVPESEGVRDGDAFYCCEEHRRQSAGR